MKTKILKTIVCCCLVIHSIFTDAQSPDWNMAGNLVNGNEFFGATPASINPIQFTHFADLPISRFEWHTTLNEITDERMRLTNSGFLGINTQSPLNLLELYGSDNIEPWGMRINSVVTGTSEFDGLYLGTIPDPVGGQTFGRLNWLENNEFSIYQNNWERIRFTQLDNYTGINGATGINYSRIRLPVLTDDGDPLSPLIMLEPLSQLHMGYFTLKMYLPQDDINYQLEFIGQGGQTLKKMDITEESETILEVETTLLSQGTYVIVLLGNGEVIDTEKMVKI